MGDEARILIERIFEEIVNDGNVGLIDELYTEDFVGHGPMGDIVGREAFKGLVATWRGAVPDIHCDISHVFSDGDMVAWIVRATGTHTGNGLGFPATGKRFDTLSANIGRMRDGRAAEHWSEQGMFPLLLQLGVIPTPQGTRA